MDEYEVEQESVLTDEEWDNRRLCSDGSCIGVIGPDGLCKECREPGSDEPARASESIASTGSEENEWDEESLDQDSEHENEADDISADEWDNRKLCSDGACIGVIGPDGLCKECGTPYDENDQD